MDSAAFFVLIIGVVIVAIMFSGGPSDLSFLGGPSGLGPYATGPGSNTEIRNPQPVAEQKSSGGFFGTLGSLAHPPPSPSPSSAATAMPVAKTPGHSPYEGIIRISYVERSSDSPQDEYVALMNGGWFSSLNFSVDITGWTIESIKHDRRTIGRAYDIPYIDADTRTIVLPPGGTVYAVTGTGNIGFGFRENGCTGYFNQFSRFTPGLSGSCIDRQSYERIRSQFLDAGLPGACIDYVASLPSCTVPQINFENGGKIGQNCIDYISKNISYNGCVKNYREDKNFYRNTWRVYFGLTQKLFDKSHDRIILRDQNGLFVEQFEY